MATRTTRTYPVVYGGWIGGLLALLVLIAVLVLWLTQQVSPQEALLIGALALAILLR